MKQCYTISSIKAQTYNIKNFLERPNIWRRWWQRIKCHSWTTNPFSWFPNHLLYRDWWI